MIPSYIPLNISGPKNPPISPPIKAPGTAPTPPNKPPIAAPTAVPAFTPARNPAAPANALSILSPNKRTSIKNDPIKPPLPLNGAATFLSNPLNPNLAPVLTAVSVVFLAVVVTIAEVPFFPIPGNNLFPINLSRESCATVDTPIPIAFTTGLSVLGSN